MQDAVHEGRKPARYRGETVQLLQRFPRHAQRVLVAGAGPPLEALLLQRAGVAHVAALSPTPATGASLLAEFIQGSLAETLPNGVPYDAVLWLDPPAKAADCQAALMHVPGWLAPFGQLYCCCPAEDLNAWPAVAAAAGLVVYRYWLEETPEPDLALLLVTLQSYDPIAHAQALTAAGRPDWAFDVLVTIPEALQQDEEIVVAIDLEKMFVLMEILRSPIAMSPQGLYSQANHFYHRIVAKRPDCQAAHQMQAELWRITGAPDYAARLLDTVLESAPDETLARQRAALGDPEPMPDPVVPPAWERGEHLPRILFITHPRMHYGLDVLYDGLVQLLGAAQITEYPFKPSLHGNAEGTFRNYPCAFDHPGSPEPLERIIAALRAGDYDFVLFGDCEGDLPPEERGALMSAASDVPVYAVDAMDDAIPLRAVVENDLGRRVDAYFKREMVWGIPYGPRSYPLPFAYPDGLIPKQINTNRDIPLFWAGHRQSGFRRRFLDSLEQHLGHPLPSTFEPAEYNALLSRAQVGISLFGYGFDTVRYWEIPANGAMLLSEALPIHIPYPFEDGVHAVHFKTARELLAQVDHFAAHPEEAARIAAAGHEHLCRYHTASARARQLLGWIRALGGPC